MNKFKKGDRVKCISMPPDGSGERFFKPGNGTIYIVQKYWDTNDGNRIVLDYENSEESKEFQGPSQAHHMFKRDFAWNDVCFEIVRTQDNEFIEVMRGKKRLIEI